jgi:hypothetical protein
MLKFPQGPGCTTLKPFVSVHLYRKISRDQVFSLPKPNNSQHCILRVNQQRCVLRFDWSSILIISKLSLYIYCNIAFTNLIQQVVVIWVWHGLYVLSQYFSSQKSFRCTQILYQKTRNKDDNDTEKYN